MPHTRLHVILAGKVRRVRFRLFVRNHARQSGLKGWVRNLPGGRVEFMAEGPRPALERLLELVRTGPPNANVESCQSLWSEATGEFNSFRVRWLGFI